MSLIQLLTAKLMVPIKTPELLYQIKDIKHALRETITRILDEPDENKYDKVNHVIVQINRIFGTNFTDADSVFVETTQEPECNQMCNGHSFIEIHPSSALDNEKRTGMNRNVRNYNFMTVAIGIYKQEEEVHSSASNVWEKIQSKDPPKKPLSIYIRYAAVVYSVIKSKVNLRITSSNCRVTCLICNVCIVT
jgi:hypothetical protein